MDDSSMESEASKQRGNTDAQLRQVKVRMPQVASTCESSHSQLVTPKPYHSLVRCDARAFHPKSLLRLHPPACPKSIHSNTAVVLRPHTAHPALPLACSAAVVRGLLTALQQLRSEPCPSCALTSKPAAACCWRPA